MYLWNIWSSGKEINKISPLMNVLLQTQRTQPTPNPKQNQTKPWEEVIFYLSPKDTQNRMYKDLWWGQYADSKNRKKDKCG